jgi:BirA family biotin operon repressor/biotin-[acetyl-CoA-carboxylase] ligase
LSVVCRPVHLTGIETLSLRTGLVLAELLEGLTAPGVSVAMKWPNDLLIGEAKVGGILAEARWLGETLSWVVVGVGINLRNALPSGLRIPGTSLVQHGATITSDDLARRVVAVITRAAGAVPPLAQAEIAAFRSRDWLFGRQLSLPQPGIANGITDAGRLQVVTPAGGLVVSGGPVELAPGP